MKQKSKISIAEQIETLKMKRTARIISESEYQKQIYLLEADTATIAANLTKAYEAGPAAMRAYLDGPEGSSKEARALLQKQAADSDGDAADDKITIGKGSGAAMGFMPTQNEIDVDKSLKFPLTDASSAESCLKGGNVSIAGKSIVTGGGGKFIIDGHHRWSQLYCINPDASITAIDIDISNPMDGLKATQLGIAGDIGKVPTATVQGENLLKIGEKELKNYVIETITPEVLEVFKKAGKGDNAEAISEYIWKNVQQMQQNNQPVSGAPERGIMPQTDDAENWTGDAPKVDAIKEIKRLQKLAGII